MKLCNKDIQQILDLKKKNVWLEGNIIKVIEADEESEFGQYLKDAAVRDKENRRKRLDITKQIQDQNRELIEQKEENERLMEELKDSLTEMERSSAQIESQNQELLSWKEDHEKMSAQLHDALKEAEEAKESAEEAKKSAENDLDLLQKKTQFELIGTIVKIALWIIVGVGVTTTVIYLVALFTAKDTQIIGSTWSNMFGILLTNAFSIIGTIMGVKYASEKPKSE
jgi:flagellar biosynthesis GTPase FlhF